MTTERYEGDRSDSHRSPDCPHRLDGVLERKSDENDPLSTLVTGAAALSLLGMAPPVPGPPAAGLVGQQGSTSPDTTLRNLPGYAFMVRHSPSVEAQARVMADRVGSVLDAFGPRLGIRPEIILLVLARED